MPRTSLLPAQLLAAARLQGGLVSTRQCDAHGMTDRRRSTLVRSGAWDRLIRGVYDTHQPQSGLHDFDLERWKAVWLALCAYPTAAAVGSCALMLHGVAGLPRTIAPEVAVPRGSARRPRGGIVVRQTDMRGKTVRLRGRHVAKPVVALAQALVTLDRGSWVRCADNMLNRKLILPGDLDAVRELSRRQPEFPARQRWFDPVDGRSGSPREPDARMQCHDAGIAPDDLQREFVDEQGRVWARADLAWYLGDGRWLLVEIDGNEFHSSDDQLVRDATRQNALVRDGRHIMLRFRSAHLNQPGYVPGEIGTVLQREGWRPGRQLPSLAQHPTPPPARPQQSGRATRAAV
ncbi:type IV toxin-antitoxin system AbiEi family antitoxin domain-containing protein [Promicromonospora vindobonensis]|uniref:Type IV toxin-antitoxin system AbiEi family antitoxin domain-containing protein n=1 Tax=Promicromonospora vindobonensis TaxID=195748 RepID=A0ABW5VTT4_9MICO